MSRWRSKLLNDTENVSGMGLELCVRAIVSAFDAVPGIGEQWLVTFLSLVSLNKCFRLSGPELANSAHRFCRVWSSGAQTQLRLELTPVWCQGRSSPSVG
jgi:hypothetical protein